MRIGNSSRKLLKPEELLQLSPRTAITLTPGVKPVMTTLLRYYEEPWLFHRHGWLHGVREACRMFMAAAFMLGCGIWLAGVATNLAVEKNTAGPAGPDRAVPKTAAEIVEPVNCI